MLQFSKYFLFKKYFFLREKTELTKVYISTMIQKQHKKNLSLKKKVNKHFFKEICNAFNMTSEEITTLCK